MEPKGTPKRRYFLLGCAGGFLGGLAALNMVWSFFMPLNTDYGYWPAHAFNTCLLLSMVLIAMGIRGIHWNYGDMRTGYIFGPLLLLLLFAFIAQLLGFWEYMDSSFNPEAQDYDTEVESGMHYGFILLGIILLMSSYTLDASKKYFLPGSEQRRTVKWGVPFLSISGLIFIGIFCFLLFSAQNAKMHLIGGPPMPIIVIDVLFIISVFILVVGLFLTGYFFGKAPMPKDPDQQNKKEPDFQSPAPSRSVT